MQAETASANAKRRTAAPPCRTRAGWSTDARHSGGVPEEPAVCRLFPGDSAMDLRRKSSRDFDRPSPNRPYAQKAIGLTVLVPKSIFVFPIDRLKASLIAVSSWLRKAWSVGGKTAYGDRDKCLRCGSVPQFSSTPSHPCRQGCEDKDCATINPTVPPQHVGREYVNLETGLNVPFSRPALGIGDFYTLPHPPEKH